MYGEDFAKGVKYEKLAEGVMTSKALINLADKYNVDLPIVRAVYNVIFENKPLNDELAKLFVRQVKKEF